MSSIQVDLRRDGQNYRLRCDLLSLNLIETRPALERLLKRAFPREKGRPFVLTVNSSTIDILDSSNALIDAIKLALEDISSDDLPLNSDDAGRLEGFSDDLSIWVKTNLCDPLVQFSTMPSSVTAVEESIARLSQTLNHIRHGGQPSVPPSLWPILKRTIMHTRRALAERTETKKDRAFDAEIHKTLDAHIAYFDQFTHAAWFRDTIPFTIPALTDYVSLEYAEKALKSPELNKRVFDEKFHILNAPALALEDLRYYRANCALRRVGICVAFIDIDDFKNYNSKTDETAVDRDILPRFMAALEGHVYARGHAYRYGGDEYLVILPNCGQDEGVLLMKKLQEKLAAIRYPGNLSGPTVTIGLCSIDDSTYLTDREVTQATARAKKFAKQSGKDCIAVSDDKNPLDDSAFRIERRASEGSAGGPTVAPNA